METYDFSLLGFIVSLAMLITWFVVVAQVIKIRRSLQQKQNWKDCVEEAKISELSNDKQAALKWYFRAMYLYRKSDPYYSESNNNDYIKSELKKQFYDPITKLGGTYPIDLMPEDKIKQELEGLEALYAAGQYTKQEFDTQKAELLKRQ